MHLQSLLFLHVRMFSILSFSFVDLTRGVEAQYHSHLNSNVKCVDPHLNSKVD
jgi:hypothetical protein